MRRSAAAACGTVLALAATALVSRPAAAADLAHAVEAVPSVIDVAFGVAGATDYRFRGITNSRKGPAVQGYVEIEAYDWFYVGVWSSSVSFPSRLGLTDPSSEIDLYAGIRQSWGAFSLDAGYLYYWYPDEKKTFPGQRQTDYWELKAVPSVAIGDHGSITGNIWWSPDYGDTGGGELYLSASPKIDLSIDSIPDVAFYVSAEIGRQWLSKNDFGDDPHDFWTWNVGGGLTYDAMTLDVRYGDTDLDRSKCFFNTGARSWCGSTVVGKIAFDMSFGKLK